MFKEINADLSAIKQQFHKHKFSSLLFNRGIHALIVYRIAHALNGYKIPVLPLLMTRIVQILYSIDIHWRAKISGGVIIIHGAGVVIGEEGYIEEGVILYHGVTLGRKYQLPSKHPNDGFPHIGKNCVLGAGAKIIGNITIGENCIIGPNCVVTNDIPQNSLVKVASNVISKRKDI